MADEEERQAPSVFVIAIILFFIFRPEEGYIRRLEFIKFLIDNGLFFRNIFIPEIIELLPLIIFVPLLIYRTYLDKFINKFMYSLMGKEIIEEFDEGRDDKLSKEEAQSSSSGNELVKEDSGEDEMEKLDRLYNEGYLSKERYDRLKQDLTR